jgi:pyruvate,water dikinase
VVEKSLFITNQKSSSARKHHRKYRNNFGKNKQFSLTDQEVINCLDGVLKLKTLSKPMDIEWAKDGLNNQLYIVRAVGNRSRQNKQASANI